TRNTKPGRHFVHRTDRRKRTPANGAEQNQFARCLARLDERDWKWHDATVAFKRSGESISAIFPCVRALAIRKRRKSPRNPNASRMPYVRKPRASVWSACALAPLSFRQLLYLRFRWSTALPQILLSLFGIIPAAERKLFIRPLYFPKTACFSSEVLPSI